MTKNDFLNLVQSTTNKNKLLSLIFSLKKTKSRVTLTNLIKENKHTKESFIKFADIYFSRENDTLNINNSELNMTNTTTSTNVVDSSTTLPVKLKFGPSTYKKGDVFMHPIFAHPYVLLEQKDGFWLCGLLTTNGDFKEVLVQCNSRIFGNSYFTKTMFTVTEPIGKFMSPYENSLQLYNVLKKLKSIFK